MSDKTKTAAEWLFQQLWEAPKDKFQWHAILDKAKQMEKEQILDAYGVVETTEQGDIMNAEQYYNETYNSKQ